MNNLSSPQGVESEHSLACPVRAQPVGQNPLCWQPQVLSAFTPALCGTLAPWHHPGAAGACGHSQPPLPRALSHPSCFAGKERHHWDPPLIPDSAEDQGSRGEGAAGHKLPHSPSSACSSQDWRQSNPSSLGFGFQGQKGPLW